MSLTDVGSGCNPPQEDEHFRKSVFIVVILQKSALIRQHYSIKSEICFLLNSQDLHFN